MKKILMLTSLLVFTILTSMFGVDSKTITSIELNENNNYIYAELNDEVDLTSVMFSDYYGKISLSSGTISNLNSSLNINENIMEINETGVLSFDFTYMSITNTVYIISKLESESSYLLYFEDYNNYTNGDFPADYEIEEGEVEVIDGALEIDSTELTTKFLLPTYLNSFSDYIIEADVEFLEVNSSSRWNTFIFRGQNTSFFQMVMRQGGTFTNGIELGKSTNGSISTLETNSYLSEFNLGELYNVRIEVFDSSADVYINDVLYLSNDELTDYDNGFIGVMNNGTVTHLDNLKITIPEDYLDFSKHNFVSIPKLYKLESNAVSSPSIIKYMKSMEDVEDLGNIVRAHTAIFKVNANFEVVDEQGQFLMTVYDALLAADGLVIPAFYIDDVSSAEALGNILKENNIIDAFIMANDTEIILAAKDIHDMVRGIIKVEYEVDKTVLTDVDLSEIRDKVNTAYSTVALLPLEYANKYNTLFLHKRLISVWVEDESSSIGETSTAIFSGADGVITNNEYSIISILQGLPENTLLINPLIIGHRGMPSKGPENTVEGGQLAVDAGAHAIEVDVQLSKDDKVIVMHDSTTTRTTGVELSVSGSTYDELKALEIIDVTNTFDDIFVPGLEDYFINFQDQDVMIVIEIKDGDILIIDKINELIDDYPDIMDQIIIISFNSSQLVKAKEVFPEYTTSSLNSGIIVGDVLASIEKTLKAIVPMGSGSNINYGAVTDEYLSEFKHRGILTTVWTLNDPADMYQYYMEATSGISTDNTYLFEDSWNDLSIENTYFEYLINSEDIVNESFLIRGEISTPNGLVYPHNPDFEIIDDGNTNLLLDGNRLISAENAGTAYIKTSFTTSLPNGDEVVLFGDVIKIVVVDASATIDPPIDEVDDGFNMLWLIPIILGSSGAIGGTYFLLKKYL